MNGDSNNATIAMSAIAARAPGLRRVARAPMRMRSNNPTASVLGVCWTRTNNIAPTTAKKLSALTMKAHWYPHNAIIKPANDGPKTRPMLNCAEPRLAAARRSSRGTMSSVRACRNGRLMAVRQPADEHDEGHRARRGAVGQRQPRQHAGHERFAQRRTQDEVAAVEPIGQRAAHGREQADRQEPGGGGDAGPTALGRCWR